jgi:hypothetical protein
MFQNIFDYSFKRTTSQAIGFYIIHLILIIITAGLIAGIIGTAVNNNTFQFGARIGQISAVIACIALGLVIIKKKQLTNNPMYLILALVAGLIAYFAGGLLGLIPVAYLTTRDKTVTK